MERMYRTSTEELQGIMISLTTNEEGAKVIIDTSFQDSTKSYLHKVVSHPRILLYIDIIQWATKFDDIPSHQIITSQSTVVGSFWPENILAQLNTYLSVSLCIRGTKSNGNFATSFLPNIIESMITT